jgi:hypothetical protein
VREVSTGARPTERAACLAVQSFKDAQTRVI